MRKIPAAVGPSARGIGGATGREECGLFIVVCDGYSVAMGLPDTVNWLLVPVRIVESLSGKGSQC
jgi:hypothetical protein